MIQVFYKRAIEKVDAQAGLLVVKILERKAALLGLDSPQKLDVVQVQAQEQPSDHDRIREAILRVARPERFRQSENGGPIADDKDNGGPGPSDRTH